MNNEEKGMSLIVKTVTRWLKGFIFLFGAYIVVFGHLSPGGGFPGGVVFAATFILLTLAFGKEYSLKKIGKILASELDSLGALLFLIIATLGIYFTGIFFSNFIEKLHPTGNFKLFSSGIIPLCNISIGMKVGASLFMIFIILSVVRVIFEDGKGKLITTEKKREK
ncbi:MAG: MnhB domain-containing protein [Candidatus Ratteibacteria bacterium]